MGSTTTAPVPSLTAHLSSAPQSGTSSTPAKGIHLGRERVKWSEEVWDRIDRAVHYEFHRTRVAAKFLPHHRVHPHVTTVPQDEILSTINGSPFSLAATLAGAPLSLNQSQVQSTPSLLPNIDEAATTRLIEIWVEFSLTPQQVEQENTFMAGHVEEPAEHADAPPEHHDAANGHRGPRKHHAYSTAVTLATRAANILSQAQDSILFQGQVATGGPQTQSAPYPPNYAGPFFTSGLVSNRGYPGDFGLLSIGPSAQSLGLPSAQIVSVPSFPPPAPGTNTVQIITISGATAGTAFTLTEGANVSGSIAWSATNSTLLTNIQTALFALPGINSATAAITAGSLTNGIGTIQVTFLGALSTTVALLTANVTTAPGTVTVGVPGRYVENIIRAIDTAYSLLQAAGHYGPYAAVLHFYPFADSYSPLPTTLILPADRIHPLMTEGYFGTGTLPGLSTAVNPPAATGLPATFNPANPSTQSMGLVVSTGGNTMDLVIGQDPITAFSQLDQNGNHLFRVLTRFALRLKDPSAVIRLEFQ